MGSLHQPGSLSNLVDCLVPAGLSLLERLQRGIPSLGDLGRATYSSMRRLTILISASLSPLKKLGAPRIAEATRGSVARVVKKSSLHPFIATRWHEFRIGLPPQRY